MRVIAGKFGSRRLKSPGKLLMRPTSDRLRETSVQRARAGCEDSLFVDLYAGTGAIGIEADQPRRARDDFRRGACRVRAAAFGKIWSRLISIAERK